MKLKCISVFFLLLIFARCGHDKLRDAVSHDFNIKMSGYQLLSAIPGEGDAAVCYMYIKYKDTISGAIKDTVWQYWNLEKGWTHSDEHMKIVKDKEKND